MLLAPTMTIPPVATTSWLPIVVPPYWAHLPTYLLFSMHAMPMFTKPKHPCPSFDNGIDHNVLLKLLT